jgi:hypothetical protein
MASSALNSIKISKPVVQNGLLSFKVTRSENIKKYLLCDIIEFQYNTDIASVPESILYIPPLSSLICIAWATGADVIIEDIDKAYLHSLERIKAVFGKWFSRFSFAGRIHAIHITENYISENKNIALLFTGGIDSLSSLISNIEKNPALICIWGASHPFSENRSPAKRIRWEQNFLHHNIYNSQIYFVSSNIGNIINGHLLAKQFIEETTGSDDWWETVSHGVTLTGLTAPITFSERIANVLIASSTTKINDKPNGSHLFAFTNMKWANTSISYDLPDYLRQDKIGKIIAGKSQYYNFIKVCDVIREKEHNCGLCEKCLRTIIGLTLENIDPNKCNFKINNRIFGYIKACFENNLMRIGYEQLVCWEELQEYVKNRKPNNTYNVELFYCWFSRFNLSSYVLKKRGFFQLTKRFYYLYKYDSVIAIKELFRFCPSVMLWFVKKYFSYRTTR